MGPLGDPNLGEPIDNDFMVPSCKFLREATISFTFTELEPTDLPKDRVIGVIGDIGGDSTGGETEPGEDMNGRVFTQEDSKASLRGEPSYESTECALRGLC